VKCIGVLFIIAEADIVECDLLLEMGKRLRALPRIAFIGPAQYFDDGNELCFHLRHRNDGPLDIAQWTLHAIEKGDTGKCGSKGEASQTGDAGQQQQVAKLGHGRQDSVEALCRDSQALGLF